jgi:polysaccharide export outer membrane protein
MKNIIYIYTSVFSFMLLFSSCASSEKIVYFQDVEGIEFQDSILNFQPQIQIGDLLYINVSATNAEAAIPFNLFETPSVAGGMGSGDPLQYLVNVDGAINFPILGKVHVKGYTTQELIEKFEKILTEYINNPVINLRITNFKVSVLGEVMTPGSINVPNERITIIEAIGMAGDLSIYGQRETVLLIREINGSKEFITLNLTNKKIFDSPYYFLKQNDVIYVTPNKTKINASAVGPNTGIIISSLSLLLAVVALLL